MTIDERAALEAQIVELQAQLAAADSEVDEIDRLRESLEAIHGIFLDRDNMKRVFEHAARAALADLDAAIERGVG